MDVSRNSTKLRQLAEKMNISDDKNNDSEVEYDYHNNSDEEISKIFSTM